MAIIQLATAAYKKLHLDQSPMLHDYLRRTKRRLISRGNRFRLRGKGNVLQHDGAVLRHVQFNVTGDNNLIRIGPDAYLSGVKVHMEGSNHTLVIGEGCRCDNGGIFWFQDSNNRLEIGKNSSLQSFFFGLIESDHSIIVGSECMFSDGVDLRTADSHSIIDLSTGKRTNWAASIQVGDHVWLAQSARIAKGVKIGSNSVIAAGSIVTKDIPANCLAGGIPAKVLRDNFSWERNRLGPNDVVRIRD